MNTLSLFLLERIESPALNPGEACPWPEYMVDASSATVVVASSQEEARKLAAKASTDEGAQVWLDPRFTLATLLDTSYCTTKPHVIIQGYAPTPHCA